MKEYIPLGWLKQEPSCQPTYRRRNKAGGRYIPVTQLGVALRPLAQWNRNLKNLLATGVKFIITDGQLALRLNTYH